MDDNQVQNFPTENLPQGDLGDQGNVESKMEDQVLQTIHSMLINKQSIMEDDTSEEESERESITSPVIITDSPGPVDALKGLFQSVGGMDNAKPRSEQASHMTGQQDHVKNEQQMPGVSHSDNHSVNRSASRPPGVPGVSHSDNHSVNRSDSRPPGRVQLSGETSKDMDMVTNVTTTAVNYHDQEDKRKEGNTGEKKRKKTSNSSKSDGDSPPYCENVLTPNINGSGENAESESDLLYPVFWKKASDTNNQKEKDSKEKREGKKNKRRKCKVQPTKEEGDSEELTSLGQQNLQVLDIRTVVNLYEKIKLVLADHKKAVGKELTDMKRDMDTVLEHMKKEIRKEVEADTQKAMEAYEEKITKLETTIRNERHINQVTVDTVQFNYQVICDLAKRLYSVEMANARRAVVLTGLRFSEKKFERNEQIEHFFEEALEVHISVDDSYFLGSGDVKSVVIIFETCKDKQRVFAQKELLNGITGENGKDVYLNSYLPAEVKERKRREKDVVRQAKQDDPKASVERSATGIKIGSTPYKKKVEAPDPTQLLQLSGEELERILTKDSVKGTPIQAKDSLFIPYSADVKDFQGVRDVYLKIRLMHARARHVVCAFNLPGTPTYLHNDYQDDGENGAGRAVLNYLCDNKLSNKAIFIARICGRAKLNQDRLAAYVRAAHSVMTTNNYNFILKEHQAVMPPEQLWDQRRRQQGEKSLTTGKDSDGKKQKQAKHQYRVRQPSVRGGKKYSFRNYQTGRKQVSSYSGAVKFNNRKQQQYQAEGDLNQENSEDDLS